MKRVATVERDGVSYRICKTCSESYLLSEFPVNRDSKRGHRYNCRSCHNRLKRLTRGSTSAGRIPGKKPLPKHTPCPKCSRLKSRVANLCKTCFVESITGKRPGSKGIKVYKTRSLSKMAVYRVFKKFDGKCAYCSCETDTMQLDHIVPRASGGLDEESNLVPACPSCNGKKGAKKILDSAGQLVMEVS